jgi:hypothetical protein
MHLSSSQARQIVDILVEACPWLRDPYDGTDMAMQIAGGFDQLPIAGRLGWGATLRDWGHSLSIAAAPSERTAERDALAASLQRRIDLVAPPLGAFA